MEKVKFDELDRDRVIDALQEYYGVQLDKIPPYRKWLRDESGRNWWVLGGIDDWHGIPKEMMDHEKESQIEGMFVFAVRKRTSIEMFGGPPTHLVSSRAKLDLKEDQYRFNVVAQGDFVRCIQVPDVMLERITSFSHSDEDRERLRNMKELIKIAKKLSDEELDEFMERLSQGGDSGEVA